MGVPKLWYEPIANGDMRRGVGDDRGSGSDTADVAQLSPLHHLHTRFPRSILL